MECKTHINLHNEIVLNSVVPTQSFPSIILSIVIRSGRVALCTVEVTGLNIALLFLNRVFRKIYKVKPIHSKFSSRLLISFNYCT